MTCGARRAGCTEARMMGHARVGGAAALEKNMGRSTAGQRQVWVGFNLRHQSDKVNNLEMGLVLFRWATQIMGVKWRS